MLKQLAVCLIVLCGKLILATMIMVIFFPFAVQVSILVVQLY